LVDALINQTKLDEAIVKLEEVKSKIDIFIGDETTQTLLTGLIDSLIESLEIASTPANLPPVANDDSILTPEGTSIAILVLANDGDPEGQPLTILSVSNPTNGTIVNNLNGTITYNPNSEFNGQDSFNYTIADSTSIGEGTGTDNAIVSITVTQVNDVPVGVADSYLVDEGATINTLSDGLDSVLLNDTDVEGDQLTAVLVSSPSHADSFSLGSDGNFRYIHDGSETTSDSFTYVANDGLDQSTVVVVTLSINPVSDAPVGVADSYSVATSSTIDTFSDGLDSVLDNDSDIEGDELTAVLVSSPSHAASFSLGSDGHFTYTHDGSESSSDTFRYKANDGTSDSNVVTVTITSGVQDTEPPEITASLVPIDVEDDEGLFRVEFSASDESGVGSITATLNGITVTNGQIVELELDDEEEVEFEDGILEIEASSFTLTVTATDELGNTSVLTISPTFTGTDDDDDDDDDAKHDDDDNDDDNDDDDDDGDDDD